MSLLIALPLATFGVAFLAWTALDWYEMTMQGNTHMRNQHRSHVLLSAWSLFMVIVTLARGANLDDLTFSSLLTLTGVMYLLAGIRDLHQEVLLSHTPRNFMCAPTLLTRCAALLPLWSTLIVGVLGTLFGLDHWLLSLCGASGQLRDQVSPYVLIACGLGMLYIYARVIAWQNAELQKLVQEVAFFDSEEAWLRYSTAEKHTDPKLAVTGSASKVLDVIGCD